MKIHPLITEKIISLLIIAIISIALSKCGFDIVKSIKSENVTYKKPLIIVKKFGFYEKNNTLFCDYKFQDANGNSGTFAERFEMYEIGDSIK